MPTYELWPYNVIMPISNTDSHSNFESMHTKYRDEVVLAIIYIRSSFFLLVSLTVSQ